MRDKPNGAQQKPRGSTIMLSFDDLIPTEQVCRFLLEVNKTIRNRGGPVHFSAKNTGGKQEELLRALGVIDALEDAYEQTYDFMSPDDSDVTAGSKSAKEQDWRRRR